MDKQTAITILNRYRMGSCTEEERQLVEHWVLHGAADPLDLSDAQLLEDLLDIRVRLERDLRAETPIRKLSFRKWLPYAAAFLVMTFSVVLYYFSGQSDRQSETVNLTVNDIEPGRNRATLTLADGRTIDLSAEQSEIIVGDNGIMYSNGTILEQGSRDEQARLAIYDLQLPTPKGGTYQVTLPDGTKVWLNSASTLTYPNRFAGDERIVELDGEAYFEVSGQWVVTGNERRVKIPFLVKTSDQIVEVLGTQFNISAYADEDKTLTTLVEGSVKVTLAASSLTHSITQSPNHPHILKPGTQSIVQNGHTTINEVDVSTFIGWKEGYFVFDGTELRDAMKQLSRWYDVEVIYEGIIPRTPFYGRISRGDSLAQVLEIFKEGKVNFRIEKHDAVNRLIVMP